MAKARKLTVDEREQARAYAAKKWPDESVSVEDEVNEGGKIVFKRLKTSSKRLSKVTKAKT